MADELNKKLGIRSQLIEGAGGVFEIEYGGKLVFSKAKLGRFPEEDEVASLIEKAT